MTPADGSGAVAKFVEAVKDLPAWLFSAFAVAAAVLFFVPVVNAELPKEYRPWLVVSLVVFGVLAMFKWINVGLIESVSTYDCVEESDAAHFAIAIRAVAPEASQLTVAVYLG